jgi:hypothetical protein
MSSKNIVFMENTRKFVIQQQIVENNQWPEIAMTVKEIEEAAQSVMNLPAPSPQAIKNILGKALAEIRSIKSLDYEDELGNLGNKPANFMRIFAFGSIKEANKYKKIMQACDSSAGEEGGVFLCSLKSYHALLEKLPGRGAIQEFKNRYFSMLEYDPDDAPLSEIFNEIKKLDLVDIYNDNKQDIIIKRWNPECLIVNEVWKKDLLALFPGEPTGSVYHFVYFKDLGTEKEPLLIEIKNDLMDLLDSLKIQDVWFGKKIDDAPVIDGIFKARLKISCDYDYLLIVKFLSRDDLSTYYSSNVHAIIRRKLYSRLNEGLELIYKMLNKVEITESEQKKCFEKVIEELVSKHMSRQDFIESIDIDSILSEQPPHF